MTEANFDVQHVAGGVPIKMWTRGVPVDDKAREQLTRAAIDERYGDERGEYVLCRDSKHCIDSAATNSSAARFANDSRGTDFRNNARFKALRIEASRRIRPGDEIFVAYGRNYWQQ